MKDYLKIGVLGLAVLVFSVFASASTCSTHQGTEKQDDQNIAAISGPIGSAPDLSPAAEASVHAVVHIKVEGRQMVRGREHMDPFELFFGGGRRSPSQIVPTVGYGSGVIVSRDGYIITNNHVIDKANKISVTLNDNRVFEAKTIGADPTTDLALIKIEAKGLAVLPYGDSDKLRLGEWVLAVGNPFNLTSTVTAGIVSAKARASASSRAGNMQMDSFIQTDAAVNPGNSGGALVNARGELVGINTMIYSQNGQFAGYSFAIPINVAAKVADDLRKYGTVQRAIMGVTTSEITPETTKEYDLKVSEGVVVTDFSEVSSALAAGIKKGDVITSIGGRPIKNLATLSEQMNRHTPGDKISVTVNRKGETKSFEVMLKNVQGGQSIVKPNDIDKLLGAQFGEIDERTMQSYGIRYGIEVQEVRSGKMQKAGVEAGLIILSANNEPVGSVADLNAATQRILSNAQSDKALLLKGFYPSDGNVRYFAIDLGN